MKFNPHLPARTRSGFPLRIISTDRRDATFPIVALYDDGTGEGVLTLLADGRCADLPKELDDWPAAGNPNDALNITEDDPVMIEAKRLYNMDMVSQEAPTLPFDSLLPRQKAVYMHRAAKKLNQCPPIRTLEEARLPTTLREAVDHLTKVFGSIADDPNAAAVHKVVSIYQQERFALNGLSKLMGDVCQAPTMADGYAILEDWCTSCGFAQPTAFPGVIGDIVAERRRQIEVEGWTPEHDDKHAEGEMAAAAACYALRNSCYGVTLDCGGEVPSYWPWADEWWKPKSPRRDLIQAIALLVAEVERLDRGNGGLELSTPHAINTAGRAGTYIASRASIPGRAAEWRRLRDEEGHHIVSSWIDEDGPGQTSDFSELWMRIEREIAGAQRLVLYTEPGDFPLKGALTEVGLAIANKIPVIVVAPGVEMEPRTYRPLGSWASHPLVSFASTMAEALTSA